MVQNNMQETQELDFFKGYHWQSKETLINIVEKWDKPEFDGNTTTQEYVRQAKERLVPYNVFDHITRALYDKSSESRPL
jgi:hypothetical protein